VCFCDEKKTWKEKDKVKKEKVKDIIEKIKEVKAKNLVITGGEPTLYNLIPLTNELKKNNINSFLETSGVNTILGDFTFITLHPKRNYCQKKKT
jgi:7-carboxy-7-deazaguanine synthase